MTDNRSIRESLEAQRVDVAQQILALRRDLSGIIEASSSVATDDEHDPEGTTIAFERAQTTALLNRALAQRDAVEQALTRLANGDYGTCVRCGVPISAQRLAVRPASDTCVACAARPR